MTVWPAGVLVATSEAASLVVVGHRGLGGDLVAGTVDTQVATHVHCPVIVLRPSGPPHPERPGDGRVVVGVHAGSSSTADVGFAFEEAAIRGVSLVAVHFWAGVDVEAFDSDQLLGRRARSPWRTLSEALAGYGQKHPDVAVTTELVVGLEPGRVLVEQSRGAGLVVVGSVRPRRSPAGSSARRHTHARPPRRMRSRHLHVRVGNLFARSASQVDGRVL